MNNYLKPVAFAALAAASLNVNAATYNDSIGETISGAHIDITSVEVNNTATDLIFKINLAGDPVATDWGKYMIGLNTVAGGDNTGNGWGRPISMSGMDYWVGAWVDSGNGAEVRNFTGTWPVQSATYGANPDNVSTVKDASSVTIQFNYAGLGITPGTAFLFDVYSSGGGGGDSAIDALSASTQSVANWGDAFATQTPLSYTIPAVPEPTSLALVGLGASLMINRIRRR
jgi:hypothetical protein